MGMRGLCFLPESGVDIEKLKAVCGSQDEGFVAKLLEAEREELEENDEFFEDEIDVTEDRPAAENHFRGR